MLVLASSATVEVGAADLSVLGSVIAFAAGTPGLLWSSCL